MSVPYQQPPERTTLENAEAALDQMIARLQTILREPTLTPETLVELTAILNNASYLFLYFEANDDRITFTRLLPKRDVLYNNPALDLRILVKLRGCAFDDQTVERSRLAYIRQLEEKAALDSNPVGDVIDRLKAEATSLDREVVAAQASRLEALGLRVGSDRPSTVFYHLVSRTIRSETREKLARYFALAGETERMKMADVVNQMISARWQQVARGRSTVSPLANTLLKCRTDEATVAGFLDSYMKLAVQEHESLEKEISVALGISSNPMSHFGYYLRNHFGPERPLLFDLDKCLSYICVVAKAAYNLDITLTRSPSSPVIVANASRAGEPVGRINFDLWSDHGKDLGSNHTLGIRNRADWGRIVQRPEAWVSCRFSSEHSNRQFITFQNVHSLFHEFGHASNHLLAKEVIPNQSGLEYLPLERLEYLSMWSEKWAYHALFGEYLELTDAELVRLKACQAAKKLEYRRTYVERAATALIDFECHQNSPGRIQDCFGKLCSRYDIARFVRFTDYPPYFTWPMFLANPGANFCYLWGAAWSCASFTALEKMNLTEISAYLRHSSWCEPCLTFDAPSLPPDPTAVVHFYRSSAK